MTSAFLRSLILLETTYSHVQEVSNLYIKGLLRQCGIRYDGSICTQFFSKTHSNTIYFTSRNSVYCGYVRIKSFTRRIVVTYRSEVVCTYMFSPLQYARLLKSTVCSPSSYVIQSLLKSLLINDSMRHG